MNEDLIPVPPSDPPLSARLKAAREAYAKAVLELEQYDGDVFVRDSLSWNARRAREALNRLENEAMNQAIHDHAAVHDHMLGQILQKPNTP